MRRKKRPPINETMKAARLEAKLTQHDAGQLAGISQVEVSRVEAGKGAATTAKWMRLARVYGLAIEDLV